LFRYIIIDQPPILYTKRVMNVEYPFRRRKSQRTKFLLKKLLPSCDGTTSMSIPFIYMFVVRRMKRIKSHQKASLIFRVFRLLSLNRGFEKLPGAHEETIHVENQDMRQRKTFSVQAYILGNQRMHEIETQKAMLISASRHDRWKAGGPH